MKVLQINSTFRYGGSTSRIAYDLLQVQQQAGIDAYVAYGRYTGAGTMENAICLQNKVQRKLNILRTRLFDHNGFYNEAESRKLIKWMDEIKPDIIHLHNIHNHYVNVKMLFEYIKQYDIPVVWTLHDCWPFTGHCSYFDYTGCDKWKFGCHDCPSLKEYPPTWFFDRTKQNYAEKRSVFTGVKKLVLTPPSEWLGSLVKESFLNEYPIEVINNGIDTDIFKPTDSDVKKKLNIEGKKIILAVAGNTRRKGIAYLKKILDLLTEEEVLVWVGIDKNAIGVNNSHLRVISYTNSREEMAALYSMADCFMNTTLEENFPTVNIEALACGTPIVTFNTGGSIEAVLDGEIINEEGGIRYTKVGAVVEKGNIDDMLVAVRRVLNLGKQNYLNNCVCKAKERYDKRKQYQKYIELYNSIIK